MFIGPELAIVMSGRKAKNCALEEEGGCTQQDQRAADTDALKRVSGLRKIYYTRAVKRREKERRLKKQSQDEGEEDEQNTRRAGHSRQNAEAKEYKKSYAAFSREIFKIFGKIFYYNCEPWHCEVSSRYSRYRRQKSMRFLKSNMDSDEE